MGQPRHLGCFVADKHWTDLLCRQVGTISGKPSALRYELLTWLWILLTIGWVGDI